MPSVRKTQKRHGGVTKSELERAARRLAASEGAGGAGPAAAGVNLPDNLEQYYDMTSTGNLSMEEMEKVIQAKLDAAYANVPANLERYYRMINAGNLSWADLDEMIASGLGKYNVATFRANRYSGIRRPLRMHSASQSRAASSQRPPSERKLSRKQEKAVVAAQAEADRLERELRFAEWKSSRPTGSRSEFNREVPPRSKSEVARRRKRAIEEALNRM